MTRAKNGLHELKSPIDALAVLASASMLNRHN